MKQSERQGHLQATDCSSNDQIPKQHETYQSLKKKEAMQHELFVLLVEKLTSKLNQSVLEKRNAIHYRIQAIVATKGQELLTELEDAKEKGIAAKEDMKAYKQEYEAVVNELLLSLLPSELENVSNKETEKEKHHNTSRFSHRQEFAKQNITFADQSTIKDKLNEIRLRNEQYSHAPFWKNFYYDAVNQRYFETLESGSPNSDNKIMNIHGLVGSTEDFIRQHAAHTGQDSHMISLQLFHNTKQVKEIKTPDIQSTIDYIMQFISHIDVSSPFHLHGSSIGGQVAFMLAAQYPEKIKSLILCGSAGLKNDIEIATNLNRVKDSIRKSQVVGMRIVGMAASQYFHNKEMVPANMQKYLYKLIISDQHMNWITQMAHSTSNTQENTQILHNLAEHNIPTLITHGLQDDITKPELAIKMKGIMPHAFLELFDGSHHTPYMDQPQAYNQAFYAWIKTHS